MQLRVPHRGATPQAANQKATLLEWEVYSPTSINPVFLQVGITASHIIFQKNLLKFKAICQNVVISNPVNNSAMNPIKHLARSSFYEVLQCLDTL